MNKPNIPPGLGQYGAMPVIRDAQNNRDFPIAQAIPIRVSNVEAPFVCPACEITLEPEVMSKILIMCLWHPGGELRMACPTCAVLGPILKVTP